MLSIAASWRAAVRQNAISVVHAAVLVALVVLPIGYWVIHTRGDQPVFS